MRSLLGSGVRALTGKCARAYTPEVLQSRIPLESLVKVELLRQEESQRVREIWLEHHKSKDDAVGDVLTPAEADLIQERSRRAPHFVLPVFRGEGFVNLLANALPGEQRVLFSHLEDYKLNPATAPSQLTLALYDEFALDKNIVLMRGEMSNVMLKKEAHQLMKLWIHMYTDEPSFEWVEKFNLRPQEFDFNAYIKAFESLQKE
mmetsp:Transcript_6506/g.25185  ORF Transcript_6506/g.25185 Transcript_6506/m.25185 type:complete len:204 (-) Transcript_6506:27-638(-)